MSTQKNYNSGVHHKTTSVFTTNKKTTTLEIMTTETPLKVYYTPVVISTSIPKSKKDEGKNVNINFFAVAERHLIHVRNFRLFGLAG